MSTVIERRASVEPSAEDVELARESERVIQRYEPHGRTAKIQVVTATDEERLPLPESALRLIEEAIHRIAQGQAVVLSVEEEEMTTQQAADLLSVSRPYLIGLLESGEMPFRKVGKHRRIRRRDVLAYKEKADGDAERAYAELVALGQELRLDEDA